MTSPFADPPVPVPGPRVNQPFLEHMRLPPATISPGTARLEFTVQTVHLRLGGIVHGGVYATVLDTVTGYAAYSVAPPGHEVLTMQLNLNMTASAKLGDAVVATAKVQHSGKLTAVISSELRLADGKLVAMGTATMFFVSGAIVSLRFLFHSNASPIRTRKSVCAPTAAELKPTA
jgi:uncharacterized protein (TIGR00369 family)